MNKYDLSFGLFSRKTMLLVGQMPPISQLYSRCCNGRTTWGTTELRRWRVGGLICHTANSRHKTTVISLIIPRRNENFFTICAIKLEKIIILLDTDNTQIKFTVTDYSLTWPKSWFYIIPNPPKFRLTQQAINIYKHRIKHREKQV